MSFSVLRAAARSLPGGPGRQLACLGARLHYLLAPAKRAAVRTNLAHVLAWQGAAAGRRELDALARRTFQSHGLLLYEWLRDGAGIELRFDGLAHLEAARAAGRGVVITTCHLGNWEVAALELARRGFPLHVVTGEQLGRLGAAVRRHKAAHGITVVRPEGGMRRLFRALAGGAFVVLLIDGNVYRNARQARFFDRSTALPFGAARLARATGAELIAAAMVRTAPGAYTVAIRPPLDTAASERGLMQQVLAALEPLIAAQPHQWCLFRPLWPGDAQGGAAA